MAARRWSPQRLRCGSGRGRRQVGTDGGWSEDAAAFVGRGEAARAAPDSGFGGWSEDAVAFVGRDEAT